jgi:hypothetical protein
MLRNKRNDLAYERGRLVARLGVVTSELVSIDYSLKLLDPHWKALLDIARGAAAAVIANTSDSIEAATELVKLWLIASVHA